MSKKKSFISKLLVTLLVFSLAMFFIQRKSTTETEAQQTGNTYYVAPNGNDNNPGTIDQPWATPDKASYEAQAGDTVYFRDGIYYNDGYTDDNALIRPHNSGTPEAWIVFKAYPGENPVIIHDAYYSKPIYIDRVSYIEINGFTTEAAGANGSGIGIDTAHDIRIINCTARNGATAGIGAINAVDHILFEGNTVYSNANRGLWLGSGISINNSGCHFPTNHSSGGECVLINDGVPGYHIIIRNNIIYDNRNDGVPEFIGNPDRLPSDGNGIIMDNCGANNPKTLIANNLIFHNGGRCIHNFLSANIDVFNNTCYHNQETPRLSSSGEITIAGNASTSFNIKIKNNLVYSNYTDGAGEALAIYGDPSPLTENYELDYNLWYRDNWDDSAITLPWGGNHSLGDHDITGQNPQFVNPTLDPTTADFHLQPTSPAINAGTDVGVDEDFDGNPRPQGAGYDIGAYEYGGSPPTPTCGDGNVGVGEECDPPGNTSQCSYGACQSDCTCPLYQHCLPLGDVDCSGQVNSIDFSYLVAHYNTSDSKADLDDSGMVNALDVSQLLANFGQSN